MYNRRRIRPDGGYYRETRRQRLSNLGRGGASSLVYFAVIACVLIIGMIWILRR